jgi:endonuclease/exonuclease/phosphatase family metal-dependent hydrolase
MSKTFSAMTCNVHSCIGMDGRTSPLRIAEVIDRSPLTRLASDHLPLIATLELP